MYHYQKEEKEEAAKQYGVVRSDSRTHLVLHRIFKALDVEDVLQELADAKPFGILLLIQLIYLLLIAITSLMIPITFSSTSIVPKC